MLHLQNIPKLPLSVQAYDLVYYDYGSFHRCFIYGCSYQTNYRQHFFSPSANLRLFLSRRSIPFKQIFSLKCFWSDGRDVLLTRTPFKHPEFCKLFINSALTCDRPYYGNMVFNSNFTHFYIDENHLYVYTSSKVTE